MNKIFSTGAISAGIWFLTALYMPLGLVIVRTENAAHLSAGNWIVVTGLALIVSIPAFICLLIVLPLIKYFCSELKSRLFAFVALLFFTTLGYGALIDLFNVHVFSNGYSDFLAGTCVLFGAAVLAALTKIRSLLSYFSDAAIYPQSLSALFNFLITINKTPMEQSFTQEPAPAHSNRLLFKGLITGGLILLMMIPTLFIQNLVRERETRQKEVVAEVSSKWASAQTLSGPFLVVPYLENITGSDGSALPIRSQMIVAADQLFMNGKITPEERPRSIYKVLLYRTRLNFSGSFRPQWPADINSANLDLANAKLCFSLSDYKGIEEEVSITFNNQKYMLNPGLPLNDFGSAGLSVPVNLNGAFTGAPVLFNMELLLKGSSQLHFIPLSANSKYVLSSSWPDPSFEGNNLPTARTVKDSGFVSQWNFNRANNAFGTVVRAGQLKAGATAFGVSMAQPADQYNKTMRSVKYAILIIGLTFALFFIIEIMQKKPVHPVQYVLVGLALVIFYTLLLSISEFILFDYAYLIAAAATVILITLYAKAHFNTWRTASIFGISLGALYGFVFVLIRLEDTALLVGSIGLFVILALVMYASRKISWYGQEQVKEQL